MEKNKNEDRQRNESKDLSTEVQIIWYITEAYQGPIDNLLWYQVTFFFNAILDASSNVLVIFLFHNDVVCEQFILNIIFVRFLFIYGN